MSSLTSLSEAVIYSILKFTLTQSCDIHTSIKNNLNFKDMFTAFQAQYRRFLPIAAGTALALPCCLLSTLADKIACSLAFQFSYSYGVWNPLLLQRFPCYMVGFAALIFFSNYICEQLWTQLELHSRYILLQRAVKSATSANCSSLRGAVIQGSRLFEHTIKAPSKPCAIIPECLVLTDPKTLSKNL